MSIELQNKYKGHLDRQVSLYKEWLLKNNKDSLWLHFGDDHYFFTDDQTKNYRANPFALYVVNEPRAISSWINIDKNGKVIFFQYQNLGFWNDPIVFDMDLFKEFIDIRVIGDFSDIKNELNASKSAVIGDNEKLYNEIGFSSINDVELILDIQTLRRVKTEYELELLYQAQYKAIQAHKLIKNVLNDGLSEFELHALYLEKCNMYDRNQGYNGIIAYNEGGSILHYNNLKFEKPSVFRSLLIDAGATYKGYQADITRTYNIDGNELFQDLIDYMVNIKHKLIEKIRPGINTSDIQKENLLLISELLVDSGIVKGIPSELYELKIPHAFMPHGWGHSMGINVHDAIGRSNVQVIEDSQVRTKLCLEVGNVMTVEPGLYFIRILLDKFKHSEHSSLFDWDLIDELYLYGGIRTEDNVYLDVDHIQNLTADLEG